jgi:CheY-like chemotaxis protein
VRQAQALSGSRREALRVLAPFTDHLSPAFAALRLGRPFTSAAPPSRLPTVMCKMPLCAAALLFPGGSEASTSRSEPESEFEVGDVRTMQVLIVEDHRDSRKALQRCLTRCDHDVTIAGDLQTGIESLGKQQFDAIIADIALPDGTGYALINEVRRRGIQALCIAISGYPYPSDVDEPGATGFHHHVPKPLNCDHICSLLKGGRPSKRKTSTKV